MCNDRSLALPRWALLALLLATAVPARGDVLRAGFLVVHEGNAPNSQVGWSVGAAGDVNGDGYGDVLVNGSDNNGTVWCYHGGPNPAFAAPAWTVSAGGQSPGWLGSLVSTAGDVNGDGYDDVMVSAPVLSNPESSEGVVFVYLGSPSGLSTTPHRTLEQDLASAGFGKAIDAAGDVNGDGYDDIVVGSPQYANGQSAEGRVSVYLGSASGISASPAWQFESDLASAYIGTRVAGAGDVNADGYDDVLASAPDLTNGQTGEGRVYLFLGSPAGPSASPSWTYESNVSGGRCGWGLGHAGDMNADGYSDITFDTGSFAPATGAVLVFLGGSGLPPSTPSRTYPNNHGGFADILYTAGDVNGDGCADLIASEFSANGNTGAFTILGGAQNASTIPALASRAGQQAAELFGAGARSAGDVNGDGYGDVIVGAPRYNNVHDRAGVARLYLGQPGTFANAPSWIGQGAQSDCQYGTSVAQGDWNADGYSDMAVGMPYCDVTVTDQGSVAVYYGRESGYTIPVNLLLPGPQAYGRFGYSVANAGDVDNDGIDDLLIGEPYAGSLDFPETGRTHLYKGAVAGLGSTPAWTMSGGTRPGHFGWSVAGAGDVNGDGYADVVIGAPDYAFGSFERGGQAYLYLGSATGLSSNWTWGGLGGNVGDRFGFCVAGVGDVNGDGYDDFAVGAPNKEMGFTDEGFAYVYFGSASGVNGAWSRHSNEAYAYYGVTVAGVGDINGDGLSDVAIGAPYVDLGGLIDCGFVEVYLGSTNNVPVHNFRRWGVGAGDQLGWGIAGGDINNDGYSDVVVGALLSNSGAPAGGAVYLHVGTAAGVDPIVSWQSLGTDPTGFLGYPLSLRGDASGDGVADLVVGQYNYQGGYGRVNCFYGGREGMPLTESGALRQPRQYRSNGVTNVALGGATDASGDLRIAAVARSARGRAVVRLQYQVSPNGVPWSGGPQAGIALDTGTPIPGVGSAQQAAAIATGLAPQTAYHWRLRFKSSSPYFPQTPWFYPPGNTSTERDARTAPGPSGVDDQAASGGTAPGAMMLTRLGPNPCRDALTVQFVLSTPGPARLTVHDVSGRRVATLFDGEVTTAAERTVVWDTRDDAGGRAPAGVYFLCLERGKAEVGAKVIVRR